MEYKEFHAARHEVLSQLHERITLTILETTMEHPMPADDPYLLGVHDTLLIIKRWADAAKLRSTEGPPADD